ncbi:unnamed protein product, partial [Rotaria socialis]
TTAMSNHKCKCLVSSNENQSKIELIPLVKSNTSTTYSDTTTSDSTNSVNHKTLQKHKRLMTSVISDWVCSNTRPTNIVEDIGLKELVEQCIKTSAQFFNATQCFVFFVSLLRLRLWSSICFINFTLSKDNIERNQRNSKQSSK